MTSGSPDGVNAPLLGQVVAERYFVEKHLGEGGMGTVYRARHVTLDKLVALKVLHGEFSRKEDLVERFLQEAKAASRIRNAHVIDITDFGMTAEGYVFFAMEYLEGKDLHGLIKEATDQGTLVPWVRARDIFLQVCEALGAAHAQNIVHRDLKPENVFLVDGTGRTDYVKLLDFGIAKVESAGGEGEDSERKLTKTGMLFGTPEYMAPEQARGEKPDLRVDVYAMGCMLFQFLTGTVPFKADSFMAILTQHMVEPVPEISPELLARSGAPIEILNVVHRALEKDRNRRYSNMAELAAAVREASAGLSTAGPLPQASGPAGRAQRPTASGGDWTGSVRLIEELVEEADEQFAAATESEAHERAGKNKWILPAVAVAAIGGAGVALALMMGGGDKATPASQESTTPIPQEQPAIVEPEMPSPQDPPDSIEPELGTRPTTDIAKPTEKPDTTGGARPATGKTSQTSEASATGATKTPDRSTATSDTTTASSTSDGTQAADKTADKTAEGEGKQGLPPKEKTPGDESPGEPSIKSPFETSASPAPQPSPAP